MGKRNLELEADHNTRNSSGEVIQLICKKTRRGMSPKNLQEYLLATNGYKEDAKGKDHNDNNNILDQEKQDEDTPETVTSNGSEIVTVNSESEDSEGSDSDETASSQGTTESSSSSGSNSSNSKANTNRTPVLNGMVSPNKIQRPIKVEIVGSSPSSSELDTSASSTPEVTVQKTRPINGHRPAPASVQRIRNNRLSAAGLGVSTIPSPSPSSKNPFPTPPASSESSNASNSEAGPSTRTTRVVRASVSPTPAPKDKEEASPIASSSSASGGEVKKKESNQPRTTETADDLPTAIRKGKVIKMTRNLWEQVKKYSKLTVQVELTCIDDDGEIPGRPKPTGVGSESECSEDEDAADEDKEDKEDGGDKEDKKDNEGIDEDSDSDDDSDEDSGKDKDPSTESNPVRPKPVVGRHLGERHLIILPSMIHGQGLFTTNSIKSGEMIIEYAGEVVSSKLALERQNWYIQRRINNYVMHIDKELHIDATNEGNCSRFINHSCEPNCTAEVLNIRGVKRVLIIALKDINGGDELTYDYSFTSDELVPCFCGAETCRLFLNHNIAKLKLKPTEIKSILKAHKDQQE